MNKKNVFKIWLENNNPLFLYPIIVVLCNSCITQVPVIHMSDMSTLSNVAIRGGEANPSSVRVAPETIPEPKSSQTGGGDMCLLLIRVGMCSVHHTAEKK